MTSPLRIIFAGTPDFAAEALAALIEKKYSVVAVYTQPDRPAGRGRKLQPSPVKTLALEHDIPVQQPLNFKDEEAIQTLTSYQADLMIVAAYGLLLPKTVLETPNFGCINIHASILPRWRGAAPIQRAIAAGDNETGISIMQMDEGLDTGNVILSNTIAIEENDTGGTLHDKLAELGAKSILQYLEQQALSPNSPLDSDKQNDELATYAHKLAKDEAIIDWSKSAEEIERTIRAFNPWPVCFTYHGDNKVRVFQASLLKSNTTKNAAEITQLDKSSLHVQCGEHQLALEIMQFPGGKQLNTQQILNAKRTLFEDMPFFRLEAKDAQ